MPLARSAVLTDLDSLLNLFEHAPVSLYVTPIEAARKIWTQTLNQEGVDVFVSDEDSRNVYTCMLITVPNLLREGRKHGFLENVLTHNDYVRRGHGSAVVKAALEAPWMKGCCHVMLQSGRKEAHIHRFYERQGFEGDLRVGYVARCPIGR